MNSKIEILIELFSDEFIEWAFRTKVFYNKVIVEAAIGALKRKKNGNV